MPARVRVSAALVGLGASLLLIGCSGAQSLLNPDFLALFGAGSQVASLPGKAPALLVTVENRTDLVLEAIVSYRLSETGVETYTALVGPREKTAQALVCPIEEITLGDVGDLSVLGAVLWLGNGVPDVDPFIEVDAFNYVLMEEVNYVCGDGITFVVQPGGTRSGYQIVAFRRPGDGS